MHLSQESTPTKRPAQPADPAPVSSATSGSISRNRVGPLEWTEAWQLSDESESEGFQGASPSLKDTLRDNIYVHLSQESTPEKASGLPAAVPEIGEPFCMPQVKAELIDARRSWLNFLPARFLQMDAGRFYSDSEFSYFDSVSSSVGSSIGSSAASESELDSLQCLSEEDDLVDFSESLTSSSSSPVLATFQWNVAKEFGQVEAAHELARITLLKYEFDFSSLGMEETSHADGRRSGFHLGSAQFIDDLLAGCLDVFAIAQDPWSVHGSPVRLGSAESLLRRIYMSDLDMRISAIKELNFKQGLSEGYHEVSGVLTPQKSLSRFLTLLFAGIFPSSPEVLL